MKGYILCISAALLLASCGGNSSQKESDRLTGMAAEEYLVPLRPGGVDGAPFWNIHATRFLYAPAFGFESVEGAAKYSFRAVHEDGTVLGFMADTPAASLAGIWNSLQPGNVTLTVEALDEAGNVIGTAGTRTFVRGYPFVATDVTPARDYREAALKACLYVHNMPAVRHWKESREPDMSYPFNAYVSKIIGATVRTECLIAGEMPELREDALAIALNAGEYLVSMSYGDDSPLRGWPPTYGAAPSDPSSHPAKVVRLNSGKVMLLEASVPGEAYLDLFDATGDAVWKERARTVAETFGRIQSEDGSWPTRIDGTTGRQIGCTKAYPGHILRFLNRCIEDYGMEEFRAMVDNAERYIRDVAMKDFDLTGQFEDSLYDTLAPYSNLTNFTASPYADYLLTKADPTDEDVVNARDLIRLSEDQFVHWDYPLDSLGFKDRVTPCVNEQYFYEVPIDASAADVCDGYLALYEYDGDPLALAKAEALLAALTRAQDPVTGKMPTFLMYNGGYDQRPEDFWLNCSWWSAKALLRLDRNLKGGSRSSE